MWFIICNLRSIRFKNKELGRCFGNIRPKGRLVLFSTFRAIYFTSDIWAYYLREMIASCEPIPTFSETEMKAISILGSISTNEIFTKSNAALNNFIDSWITLKNSINHASPFITPDSALLMNANIHFVTKRRVDEEAFG